MPHPLWQLYKDVVTFCHFSHHSGCALFLFSCQEIRKSSQRSGVGSVTCNSMTVVGLVYWYWVVLLFMRIYLLCPWERWTRLDGGGGREMAKSHHARVSVQREVLDEQKLEELTKRLDYSERHPPLTSRLKQHLRYSTCQRAHRFIFLLFEEALASRCCTCCTAVNSFCIFGTHTIWTASY